MNESVEMVGSLRLSETDCYLNGYTRVSTSRRGLGARKGAQKCEEA